MENSCGNSGFTFKVIVGNWYSNSSGPRCNGSADGPFILQNILSLSQLTHFTVYSSQMLISFLKLWFCNISLTVKAQCVHVVHCTFLIVSVCLTCCLVVVATFWRTDAGVHACLCVIICHFISEECLPVCLLYWYKDLFLECLICFSSPQ